MLSRPGPYAEEVLNAFSAYTRKVVLCSNPAFKWVKIHPESYNENLICSFWVYKMVKYLRILMTLM